MSFSDSKEHSAFEDPARAVHIQHQFQYGEYIRMWEVFRWWSLVEMGGAFWMFTDVTYGEESIQGFQRYFVYDILIFLFCSPTNL